MLVAIRIWTKLKHSIPPGFGKYYSLIPDPTAGKVTVVARMPTLGLPGLWSNSPPNARLTISPSEKKGPYSQLHRSIVAMGMPLAAPSTAMMARNATRNNTGPTPSPLRIGRQHLLGRTWMSLVNHCGLELKKSRHGENEDNEDLSDEQDARFVVASDMKASDRTPLKMSWAQFVWLALALGISAYDPAWKKGHPCTFKNDKEEDFIHLSYEEDRLLAKLVPRGELTYSLQRAFAWHNIKLDGDRLTLLGRNKSAQVSLASVTISPELSTCRRGMDLDPQECSSTIRGREPQDCGNPLAAACYWMLYRRSQHLGSKEPISVSEHLLEYRQRVLCHLRLLDDQNKLATKVRLLLLAGEVDHSAAKQATNVLATTSTTQKTETSLPQSDPPLDLATKTEGTGTEKPVEYLPLSTQSQSLVDDILEQLRSCFASSKYVQRHAEFQEQILLIGEKDFKRYIMSTPTRLANARGKLVMVKPQWSSLEPQARQSNKSKVKEDRYDLIPSGSKADLESSVNSWALDPSEQSGSPWNEDSRMGFVACVALAFADWDDHGSEAWRLRDYVQSMVDLIKRVLADDEDGLRLRVTWSRREDDRMKDFHRDASIGILEKGLYTAPSEDPVSQLLRLREEDATVYLL
jgi:hypothetical protein